MDATLVKDIERVARALFSSVYDFDDAPKLNGLQKHEREFWRRYEQIRRIYKGAKKDTEPIVFILIFLR